MVNPAVSGHSPARGPPTWVQKVSAHTHVPSPEGSEAPCMSHGLGIWGEVLPYMSTIPTSLTPALSFLGMSGLPFCPQANLLSGPQSYGPSRETNSCPEGETTGTSSLSAPLRLWRRMGEGGVLKEDQEKLPGPWRCQGAARSLLIESVGHSKVKNHHHHHHYLRHKRE